MPKHKTKLLVRMPAFTTGERGARSPKCTYARTCRRPEPGAMRTKIQHERRVELALEGLRYFDLRRWGLAKQKLNGFVQNPANPNIKTIYKDNFDFWPIPPLPRCFGGADYLLKGL
jgi:hypothetical protein